MKIKIRNLFIATLSVAYYLQDALMHSNVMNVMASERDNP